MANKLVKGKKYLNKFHEETTKEKLESVKSSRNLTRTWEYMNEQAKMVQPNGQHLKREY